MFGQIGDLLRGRAGQDRSGTGNRIELAVAALLVEAALRDDLFDAAESDIARAALQAQFGLTPERAKELLAEAEATVAEAPALYRYTRAINDHFSPAEKAELAEKLWRVIHADGRVDDYEAALMRQLGGLIHLGDQELAMARRRAIGYTYF